MIKILQLTFLFTLFVLSNGINAQETLLLETFDDSTLGQFTQFSEVGDGEAWRAADFNDKFFAQMNGFNGGVQDNLDWLISPALDMSGFDDEILTFENAQNFDGPALELLYSEDYSGSGDPTVATWVDITSSATWSPGDYEYVESGEIDLSGVTGTAFIAFRYTSSPDLQGKLYQLDNIMVEATTMTTNNNETDFSEKMTTPYVSHDNLVFTVLEGEMTISVVTTNGSLVSNLNNKVVRGDVSIPVGDLPRGVYVLVVNTASAMKSFKFVK